MIWLTMVFCGIACFFDLKDREIPDPLCGVTLLSGLFCAALGWLSISWQGSLMGFFVAFLLVIPFALRDGLGGGDLKLLAALGAWLGPWGALSVLCWTALSGMIVALIVAGAGRKDFAYAPAITLGTLIYLVFPQGLAWVAGWG